MTRKVVLWIAAGLGTLIILGGAFFINKFNKAFFGAPTEWASFQYNNLEIPFIWGKSMNADSVEPHAYMLIPFEIKGSDPTMEYYIQFDTGSAYSYLHENSLASLVNDTFQYREIVREDDHLIDSISLVIGNNIIPATGMKIIKGYGRKVADMKVEGRYSIGTIGMDFFGNKTFEIDFRAKVIRVFAEKPEYKGAHFEAFDYKGKRLMLPTNVNGKNRTLYYDSGSSAFGIITTKGRYDKLKDPSGEELAFSASRHGGGVPIVHCASDKVITVTKQKLPLRKVSYMDKFTSLQGLMTPFTKIGGWLGNKPFLDVILVFDLSESEFAVIRDSGHT